MWFVKQIGRDLYLEALPGDHIKKCIEEAKEHKGLTVHFDFNGLKIRIRSDTNIDLILRDVSRAHSGYIGKIVGPYPKHKLNRREIRDERAADRVKKAIREAVLASRAASINYKALLLADRVHLVQMEFKDEDLWNKFVEANMDGGYGQYIITFASNWAKLMQRERIWEAENKGFVANQTCSDADLEGLSGLQHSCAVQLLIDCWAYGSILEDLKES